MDIDHQQYDGWVCQQKAVEEKKGGGKTNVSDQFRVPEKTPKEDEKRKAKQDEKEPEENPPKKSTQVAA